MPTLSRASSEAELSRASSEAELEKLIRIYLKAETDIINEIGRLRSQGLVDYHALAELERVQTILRNMENEAWEYVPKMIEREFYVNHPEARRFYESTKCTPPATRTPRRLLWTSRTLFNGL